MKKIYLLIATMIFGGTCAMQAQNENDNNKEITVTNAEGKEEVIDLPEAMTYELDSLLRLYNSKTYLKPDTGCNMPDVNPVYDKEVYKERLSRIPSIIEMPYNDVIQKFIDRYSSHLRRSVSYMLGASNFYMPVFEQALETYGLPLELKYLPVIESGLNPKAISRVGATGLWQFMLDTGKRYGLEVNSLVDERRDLVKASYAAANYLSDLYKIYGDWNLVIAAYNAGPDKINKAIHRSKGQTDYWQIYPYLPRETRGYVPAFIAANYIMTYYCDHNICPMMTDLPAKSDTVMVNRDLHFEQISHVLGIDMDQLQELNPQYRHNVINGNTKPSSLRLPAFLVNKFIDKEDSIFAYNTSELLNKRTEVAVNNVVEEEPATYTTSHRSYYRHKSSRHSRSSKSSRRKRVGQNVTIKDGDTLSEIAERHHTSVSKLKKLNHINGSSIRAGKKIKIK
jgi:membrane-bound lytic murein transglycosylase D